MTDEEDSEAKMTAIAGLTDKQIAEYLHRSYAAVDGLWFMKVEEKCGFEAALETDEMVWKVLPKIQARMLKAMFGIGRNSGMLGLRRAVFARLNIEGFDFEIEDIPNADGIKVRIKRCPWQGLLVKSGRESICERVGDVICGCENATFAAEFGDICFRRENRMCRGDDECTLLFLRNSGIQR